MKILLLTTILFYITLPANGQRSKYKYKYRFQLEKKDTFKITNDTFNNYENVAVTIRGIVLDSKQEPEGYITIVLKNRDTIISTTTDGYGYFELKVKPSNYQMRFVGLGYKLPAYKIDMNGNYFTNFKIILYQTSDEWYNINSVRELTIQQINEIKQCVTLNLADLSQCGKKNKFYIMMEI